jgi:hypothetical protein
MFYTINKKITLLPSLCKSYLSAINSFVLQSFRLPSLFTETAFSFNAFSLHQALDLKVCFAASANHI